MGELFTTFETTVTFDRYADIRAALFSPDLSRSFDTRAYHEGNIREGMVSTAHGQLHRARRRIENTQFRPDVLKLYERTLFPEVLERLLDRLIDGNATVNIFDVGEILSVVLAARRAGIDVDEGSIEDLKVLVHFVDVFSQSSAILDAKDPDAVRAETYRIHEAFAADWVGPSRERRAAILARIDAGTATADDLPHDILSVLLMHQADPALDLDDGRIVREVATYLQGGTHTSAQTLVNALDLMFDADDGGEATVARVANDLAFAQRVVHETLRLRPTTPMIRRRAVADVEIGGQHIPAGALVLLDALKGNADPDIFGDHPERFDPDRTVDPSAARWGLSFGAGAHQCPGRSVAGGFPAPVGDAPDDHIFGLVALELQAVCRRGVTRDATSTPQRDTRTERHTRWSSYPVRFTGSVAAAAGA